MATLSSRPARCIAASALLAAASIANAQYCGSSWGNELFRAGLDYAEVTASIVFDDDGPGPHPACLYVGGQLHTADKEHVDFAAKWDGTNWSSAGAGLDAGVNAFAIFDDDGPGPRPPALYAGTYANGPGVTGALWRLDGDHWTPIAGEQGEFITTLLVFDDDGPGPHPLSLFAGGLFHPNDSFTYLAKWDGQEWTSIDEQMDSFVDTLISADEDGDGPLPPVLFAGGWFHQAGDGFVANGVARWDGASWSPLGEGLGESVRRVTALAWFDPDGPGPRPAQLYAGGEFPSYETPLSDSIARFADGKWEAVGSGIDGFNFAKHGVYSLAVFDPDGDGPAVPLLYAGGAFASIGGVNTTNMGAWNGDEWRAVGAPNLPVYTMCIYNDPDSGSLGPSLVAGGSFMRIGGQLAARVASLRGGVWSFMSNGVGGGSLGAYFPPGSSTPIGPAAMTAYDSDGPGPADARLIAAGSFTSAGGYAATNIAQWDGMRWAPLGDGLDDAATSLAVFDADADGPEPPQLYVSGHFGQTSELQGMARWNGSQWSAVPGWSGGVASSMAVLDPDGPGPEHKSLYVGCLESAQAGGVRLHGVGRWDGQSWSAVGDLPGSTHVYAMTLFDDDGPGPNPPALYIAIDTTSSNPSSNLRGIARLDGSTWSNVGDGLTYPPGVPGHAHARALAVFDDDGPGPHRPALYVAGDFYYAGPEYSPGLARWTGDHWEFVAAFAPFATTFALQVFDDAARPLHPSLFVGGVTFSTVGGIAARGIARWTDNVWTSMSGGVDANAFSIPSVQCFGVFDPDGAHRRLPTLYVGGTFTRAGSRDVQNIAPWSSSCTTCTSDLNGDRKVDGRDLTLLLAAWGPGNQQADLTGDDDVNSSDLALLLASWGPCPP